MRPQFADSSDSESSIERIVSERRRIMALIVAGVGLEAVALAFEAADVAPEFVPGLFGLLAIVVLAVLIHAFNKYAEPARATRAALTIAAIVLLAHQLVRFADTIRYFDALPVIGRGGAFHGAALHLLEPMGFAFLLGGLFLTGVEVLGARRQLARANRKLSRKLQTFESVQELEAKLGCVIDSVRDYIVTLRPDGTILDINHTARGFERESTRGTSVYDYSPPADGNTIRRAIDEACATKQPQTYEIQGQGDDGATYYYQCRMGPVLKDGEIRELVIVGTDVTVQRKSREALAAIVKGTAAAVGEEFFASLTKHLAIALEIRYAMIGRLLDGTAENVETLALWDGKRHVENFTYKLEGTPCEKVLDGETCAYPNGVSDLFPHDSLLREMKIEGYLGTPLHDLNGRCIGLLVVMHERPIRNAPLAMSVLSIFAARAEAELERLRSEREREQLAAQVQHAQKLESLGVLAGGIAHDFNNLLVGILGNIALARADIDPSSEAAEPLHDAERAAQRAAELISQMLAYSGKGRIQSRAIDLAELADETLHLIHASISKQAALTFDFETGLPRISGDPGQIRQVLMNLLVNASDALQGEPGHVALSASAVDISEPHQANGFHGDALPPGRYVRLTVSDTGQGIDEETRRRMFDPFYSTKVEGRGLGLAVVLGIVHGHGGALTVDSTPGVGTTFTVYLPASAAPAHAEAESFTTSPASLTPSTEPVIQGATVLFADDEAYIRKLGRRVLERAGYTVLEARDGAEAISLFRDHADTIQAVVLDLTMPGLNGEDVFREIRYIRKDAAVLVSSGYADQAIADRVCRLGVRDFLAKPYRAEVLVEKVGALMTAASPVPSK